MKCIILAAGYATRLYPLTENFPKPLLPVSGKPILDHLIDDIAAGGSVDSFIVVSNHRFAQNFRDWAESRNGDANILIADDGTSTNDTRLGAVRDIQFAIEKFAIDDDLLVIAGDNLLDFSLQRFIDYSLACRTSCLMRYFEPSVPKLTKCAVVEVDTHDRILSMEEKPEHPRSHWCCPPFYYYTRSDARLVSKGIIAGCGTDAPGSFAAWLSTQVPVHAMEMPGKRYDIGTLESYQRILANFPAIS